MNAIKEKYIDAVRQACNEMRLDYFPQVEASELLYRVITLEDIYLPLSLSSSLFNSQISHDSGIDIDELVRRIDAKIAALEALEAKKTDSNTDILDSNSEKDLCPNSQETKVGYRILIDANPGSGKTTFCKRLVLAILNNDAAFFEKYAQENDLRFNQESLPILISCKNIEDMTNEEIHAHDFEGLMYALCMQNIGSNFAEISKAHFHELLVTAKSSGITIILDGWDEILDIHKENVFREKLNVFLQETPDTDVVVTIRKNYVIPKLDHPYTDQYSVAELSDDDIRKFCEKWCDIILNTKQRRAKNISTIADQILNSKDQHIKTMMRNPLDLSLLLTVSKNDVRLPDNKAELFKEFVDLYIFWSLNKGGGTLSAKSIRVFLAYIASDFTKNRRLRCDKSELIDIINQAIIDLEWSFSEEISSLNAENIVKELSHTGILTSIFDRFSFSDSAKGTHRQIQEYLTAYAISAQYADEEYNNMSVAEILADKYNSRQWREVIIFIALMNSGRLRHDIVKALIQKVKDFPNDNYIYTNLLFELIVTGVEISLVDKHKIYDVIFEEHITDQQIANIHTLVTSENRSSCDFISYIRTMFSNSVNNGESAYGYAQAVIEASLATQNGTTPFDHAKKLMESVDIVDVVAGSQILLVMAWCKYASITNVFSASSTHYKMSAEWIAIFKKRLQENRCRIPLLESVREAILASYASFGDFFDCLTIQDARSEIKTPDNEKACEIILSIAPIFDLPDLNPIGVDAGVKNKYIQQLNKQIEEKEYDKITFSFCVCVTLWCFSPSEQDEKWKEISEIYDNLKDDGYIGKAHYDQLKKAATYRERVSFLENLCTAEVASAEQLLPFSYGVPYWNRKVVQDLFAVYSAGQQDFTIVFPKDGLSKEAIGFLEETVVAGIVGKNNLAYLLRRHEFETLVINTKPPRSITVQQLLKDGVDMLESFSIINYALTISDIYANHTGNYEIGKQYLTAVRSEMRTDLDSWSGVVSWWSNLAVHSNEYEGLVVLTWLFSLDLLDLQQLDISTLSCLALQLERLNSDFADFSLFHSAICNVLDT